VRVEITKDTLGQYQGDAAVVGVCKKAPLWGAAAEADASLDGLLSKLIESGEIRAKESEVTILHTHGKMPVARIAVVGLGDAPGADLFSTRRAMGAAASLLRNRGCRRIATTLHQSAGVGARWEHSLRAVIEAAHVGLYRGDECKTETELPDDLEELTLLGVPEEDAEIAQRVARSARIAGEATNYARRLVNLPANQITPSRLAQEAVDIGTRTGLEVQILEPPQLHQLGMGAFLAVAQGSEEPARMILLRHRGKEGGPNTAFIGKGLTFDSGGISLKPPTDMHVMKSDMAGAAAVLAALSAVAELKLDLNLMALIPATENLPSGKAYKPGDVVKALNGKTIEIINTDAEGRLLLADALAYALQLGATHLVDVATLTGACVIALGHVATGVMGNDNELVEAVLDAGEREGERMWRLPLFPEYRKQLKSNIADVKNVGGRPAGTITGGWFLREFVGDTSWVHLDIAGTSWAEKAEPHQVSGATGAATRTLIALAERLSGGSL